MMGEYLTKNFDVLTETNKTILDELGFNNIEIFNEYLDEFEKVPQIPNEDKDEIIEHFNLDL